MQSGSPVHSGPFTPSCFGGRAAGAPISRCLEHFSRNFARKMLFQLEKWRREKCYSSEEKFAQAKPQLPSLEPPQLFLISSRPHSPVGLAGLFHVWAVTSVYDGPRASCSVANRGPRNS